MCQAANSQDDFLRVTTEHGVLQASGNHATRPLQKYVKHFSIGHPAAVGHPLPRGRIPGRPLRPPAHRQPPIPPSALSDPLGGGEVSGDGPAKLLPAKGALFRRGL